MSINGISGARAASDITPINANVTKPTGDTAPASGAPASSRISAPGLLLAKLNQLSQQDPEQFSAITKSVADQLHSAASQTSGVGAAIENRLGDKFEQASKDGNLSALAPTHEPDGDHAGDFSFDGTGEVATTLRGIRADALKQVHQALTPSPSDSDSTAGSAAV